MPDLVKLGLLDEDEKKKKQEKALPPVVKPGQANKSTTPAPAASSSSTKKNADPVFLGYHAEYDAPRRVVHDLEGMNDRQAIGIAQRIVGDEARDDFLTTYRSQFTSKKSENYRPNMPTLAQLRKTVDASVKGGVYSETRAAYEQQRIAQGQNIATLNGLGVTDFGGAKINWNTISFDDAIRTIRLIPDANARKTALATLKDMTKDGGRFSRYSAYDFSTSANAYIANSDFDMADYEEFFEGGEYTRGVEGSFSAAGGDSEENRAKYEEFLARIDEKGLTDWQKQWYVRRLDDIYYQTTGVKYQKEAAGQDTNVPAMADGEVAESATAQTEKTQDQPEADKPPQLGDVWKALGTIFSAGKQAKDEPEKDEEAPSAPEPSIPEMPSPSPSPTPSPTPIEGEDYAVVGEYASATASSGGRWIDSRLETAQEVMDNPRPLAPPETAQQPEQTQEPQEASIPAGTVNLVGDPVRAAEYVLAGRGNELDEETQAYIDGLMNSSTAAKAILGGWHYDEQELANRVLYGEDGAELDRYIKMFQSGQYQDNDISYIIGGRLGGYYNKTRSDTFPAELTSDTIGMILGVAMDAEEAYRNGQITYNPAEETYYDAYLRAHPEALANLNGVMRTIHEMQKEKREQDQLVADAIAAEKQAQIDSAREAVRTGDYDYEQYQLVVDNAPVMTDLDLKMDPSYVDYNAEIRAYVYDAYDDAESWIHREVLDCLEASGLAGADMHSNAAISYLDMLHASVSDQMMNDLRVARSLGYDDLAGYYAKMGGFSVEALADRAKLSLQALDAQIDPGAVEYVSSFTGTDDTHWGGAIVSGAYVGIRESQADRLEAIWALDAGHREDRPYYEQQMRQAYGEKYGYSLSAYMYKQDMLAFADAHPSAEMGQYIREYIESGADVFRLAIKPEMTWSLNKAAEIQRKADAVQSWAESTYAPSMEGTFNISKSAGANAEMQATAIVVGAITGSAEAGVAVGFGLPQITQETEAQLAEGKSMKYASTMGLMKGINTVLAESATSGALTKKALQIVGIAPMLETAGNAISNSRVVNAMVGMIKNAAGQIWDETIVDEIKEGTGWQVLGKMTEEMMSGSGIITSLLAGMQNIDVGETIEGIDMKDGVAVMLPNIFLSGLGGAMQGWKATKQAAQKVAQTGSKQAAREFVEAFAQDVVIPENRAELDSACEAMSTAVETVGRMMTDPEITPTVEEAMADQEQASAHAQEAESSQARMDADMETIEEIDERMNAGEINPDLPAAMASAAQDHAKAKQGLDEHTREEAQKRADADRKMGEAHGAASVKSSQSHSIQMQQLRDAMSEAAVQAAERAKETEVTRLQKRIADIDAQMQAEFDKGDDADFDLINNLSAQSGTLSAYLDDMMAQENGEVEAEQIRADVTQRLDAIEQAREAHVSAETQAVMETRERTRKLTEEQEALKGVFGKLRNDVIYVDETQAAEIMSELGAKSLTEVNRILGTRLTKTKGSGTPLDGSYYAELKALAPGYFKEEWDGHPESAIAALGQKRKLLRADLDQSRQDEQTALEAYRAKSAERYSGVTEKAADIPPGYALSQFENENIQTSEVGTDETNELLAGTTHKIQTHESLENKAAHRIAENGLKKTISDLMRTQRMSAEDVATARECLRILKKNGEIAKHAILSAKIGLEATRTGTELNIFSLFQKRSAENAASDTLEMASAYNKKKGRYAKAADAEAMDEQLSIGDTQYQPFMEQRVSFGTSDPAMQKLASDVAKRSGLQVFWADMPEGMRGFFMRDKGVIVLNQKVGAAQGAYIAAIHEYTHFMETAENYGEYADIVLKAAYGKDYAKSKAMLEDSGAIRDAYAEHGQELTDDLLRKELVAAATEKILLGDEAFMRTLFAGGNGGVAVRMLGAMDKFLRGRAANDQASKQEYELIEAARVKMRDAVANAGKWKAEAKSDKEAKAQFALVNPDSHYDYSKSFSEQVEDWKAGRIPDKDTLILGRTPQILRDVGFNDLPLVIDQKHMREMMIKFKNDDHHIDEDIIKKLPELIADPIAIIEADGNNQADSVLLILGVKNKNADDRQIIGAINIRKDGKANDNPIDATRVITTHSRGDLDSLIAKAVKDEDDGKFGVYYVNKKAIAFLSQTSHTGLGSLKFDGLNHSILDANSPVKANRILQTETKQFNRFIKGSIFKNSDGTPKIMYRGGNEDIEIFDRKKSKPSNLYGRGFYFTAEESQAAAYGEVHPYYLSVKHPLSATSNSRNITSDQMRAFLEAVAEDEDYGLENYGYGATVDSVLQSLRGKDDFSALQDINATAIGDFVAAIELFNQVNGTNYDGIITPTETVVFRSEQIKSADRNIGLFDPQNPNVQYSMQIERQITPGGDRQQAISDPDTYDQITAPIPDGEILMQEQPDGRQTQIKDPDEMDAREVTRRVMANIDAIMGEDISTDNPWGLPLNPFQREKIAEYKLENVELPGLAYNRATVEQRMLCAILATPQDRVGPNGDTLTQQLKDLKAGKLAVVTEADYNYILSQGAIVEGSAVDEAGVPLTREGEQAYGRMKDAQANIQPTSLAEKMSAWRYMNLLSSPVTTIKNIDGNLLIQEAERISTMGAAWLDKQIAKKTGMRTTDTATREERKAGTQAAIERGRNAFDDYFVAQTSTSRSRNYAAGGDGRVFQNTALETVRNVINFAMDAPDQMFMEKTISEEMAILERIEAKIRDEETGEIRRMTEGEMYEEAYRRASERFYHENNRMVEIMNNLYNIPGVGTAMRILIPFAKTPSNVALRMFDYSPLGLAKSILYDGLYAMNHDKGADGVGAKFDQRKFVMGMSRGMTGTMVTVAGMLLYEAGILSFGREDEENDKRRNVLGELGIPYGMYINIGDTMHEIAFTMPALAGLAVGAGLAKRYENKEGLKNVAIGVVSDQINQLFDNSYLSSINDIFRGYGDGSDIFFNTINTLGESYMTQTFSPSALRAIAKAADPYARDTGSSNSMRQLLNETVIQNWPLIRQTLPVKYDVTGDVMTQHKAYAPGGEWENAAMHWIDSLLSPTATYSAKDDAALVELLDLSYRENKTSVLPTSIIGKNDYHLSINKTEAKKIGTVARDIPLTDEQKRQINQEFGDILFNGFAGDETYKEITGLREIIESDEWAQMDDETRVNRVEDQISAVKMLVKMRVFEEYKRRNAK